MTAFGAQQYKADVAADQLLTHRGIKDFNPDS
jgi:hypothetical protein